MRGLPGAACPSQTVMLPDNQNRRLCCMLYSLQSVPPAPSHILARRFCTPISCAKCTRNAHACNAPPLLNSFEPTLRVDTSDGGRAAALNPSPTRLPSV
jgi:hypothetical protein